jgi:hypothetical protein
MAPRFVPSAGMVMLSDVAVARKASSTSAHETMTKAASERCHRDYLLSEITVARIGALYGSEIRRQ